MTSHDCAAAVAGVDEAGRGPLVGAVLTAAVILHPDRPIQGLKDSKQLSPQRRLALAAEIRERAWAWSLGRAEAWEIDHLNILQATMLAMQRAVLALPWMPGSVQVDGNRCPFLPMPVEAIVQGDSKVAAISAASILAKVARDEEMYALSVQHPAYGFDRHKGYPTPEHLAALKQWGVLPEHRRTFGPVARILAGSLV